MEYKHVYCTDCMFWEYLLESIENKWETPTICTFCYPFDPEDSAGNDLRINYIEK